MAFGLGPWRVDLEQGTALAAGQVVSLTPTEVGMLARLHAEGGEPVSRDVLLQEVWGYSEQARSRTVDTALRRLRDKLEPDRRQPTCLVTVRGQGIALGDLHASSPGGTAAPMQPLFGRDDLLDRLLGHMEEATLITLVGPPGVGRTALALGAAAGHTSARVRLEGVEHAEGAQQAVDAALRGRDVDWLVVDDWTPAAAPLLEEWLDGHQLLVTSTEPIGRPDEQILRVPPLEDAAARALVEHEAKRRDLSLDDSVIDQVVACGGGLPLALILTTPLGALGSAEVLEGGTWMSGGVVRQALRTGIERLSEAALALLRRLSVFEDRFAARAALDLGAPDALAELHQRGLVVGGQVLRVIAPIRHVVEKAPADVDQRLLELGAEDVLSEADAIYQRDYARLVVETERDEARLISGFWAAHCGSAAAFVELRTLSRLKQAARLAEDPEIAAWLRAIHVRAARIRHGKVPWVEALAARIPGVAGQWATAVQGGPVEEVLEAVKSAPLPRTVSMMVRMDLNNNEQDREVRMARFHALLTEVSGLPKAERVLRLLCASVALASGRPGEALRWLDATVGPPTIHEASCRGIALMCQGRYDEARSVFEGLVDKLDPKAGSRFQVYAAIAAFAQGQQRPLPPEEWLTAQTRSVCRWLADPSGPPPGDPWYWSVRLLQQVVEERT